MSFFHHTFAAANEKTNTTMLTRKQLENYSKEMEHLFEKRASGNPDDYDQTLYGDVLDYIRDVYPELRDMDYDDDLLAHYAIGYYAIKHCVKWV